MQIAFHLGMPFTDNDKLLWSLRQDRHALDEAGVHVPRPRFFRERLSKTTTRLRGDALSSEDQAALLDEFGAKPNTQRMVLSDPRFICNTKAIWHEFEFYGKAGFKTAWLRQAFADHEAEFFLCIRNPAGFLSALLRQDAPMTLEDHLKGADPGQIFWSKVVERITEANPGAPVTVWCSEEAPVIWPLVLAAVGGIEPDVPLAGSDALVRPLLNDEGQGSLTAAIGDPIAVTPARMVEALERHLEFYADPDDLDEEIEIPGWQEEHVAAMTEAYEADVERIAALDGVTLLQLAHFPPPVPGATPLGEHLGEAR